MLYQRTADHKRVSCKKRRSVPLTSETLKESLDLFIDLPKHSSYGITRTLCVHVHVAVNAVIALTFWRETKQCYKKFRMSLRLM